jgi:hypothetical protein
MGCLGTLFFKNKFYCYLLAFANFQKQIKFYATFSNFVSESQTIQTYFSTLFYIGICAVNHN